MYYLAPVFLLGIIILSYPTLHTLQNEVTKEILPHIVKKLSEKCTQILVYARNNDESATDKEFNSQFGDLAKSVEGGSKGVLLFNVKLMTENNFNVSDIPLFQRISRTISDSHSLCTNVILILPSELNQNHNTFLQSLLLKPLLNPTVVANEDKFIVITGAKLISSLYTSQFLRKIKYKIILSRKVEESAEIVFKAHQFCYHCSDSNIIRIPLTTNEISSKHFIDFESNLGGSVIKVSCTDKLPGVFEILTLENGKNVVKRGYHASALFHLMDGLNFTYELYRSGGKGSTGHLLPNGTWIGTVGEVYKNEVDVGIAGSLTFMRYFVIELIAPVSFEYVSFATGPPAKTYTWKSLFWPFDAMLWTAMVISTGLTLFVTYLLLKVSATRNLHLMKRSHKGKNWSIKSVLQYFAKTWIEQSGEVPSELFQPLKIILGFWLLFAMVGTYVYRAKMVTLMTFPVMDYVPETFDDLADSSYQLVFHYFGSVAYNTFKESKSSTYSSILKRMSKEPNPLKCLLATMSRQSKTACILFGASYRELKNRNLSDSFGQSPISINPDSGFMFTPGFIAKKHAVFTPNFKRILSTSLQMGIHAYWETFNFKNFLQAKNDWLRETNQTQLNYGIVRIGQKDDGDGSVHLKHLKGSFVILISGLLGAICLFFLEIAKNTCCLGKRT